MFNFAKMRGVLGMLPFGSLAGGLRPQDPDPDPDPASSRTTAFSPPGPSFSPGHGFSPGPVFSPGAGFSLGPGPLPGPSLGSVPVHSPGSIPGPYGVSVPPCSEYSSPAQILTVQKVMEAFQNARKITTPGVNSKLAMPYKLPEVKNRAEFKQAYSDAKQNITRVSGQFVTSREEEKERRRSLPFDWPSVQGIQVNQIKILK